MRVALVEWLGANAHVHEGWTAEEIDALREGGARGRPLPAQLASAALAGAFEIDILLAVARGRADVEWTLHAAGGRGAADARGPPPLAAVCARVPPAARRPRGGAGGGRAESTGHATPWAWGRNLAADARPVGAPPSRLLRDDDVLVGVAKTRRGARDPTGANVASAVAAPAAAAVQAPSRADRAALLGAAAARAREASDALAAGKSGGDPLHCLDSACLAARAADGVPTLTLRVARQCARRLPDAVCALASAAAGALDAVAFDVAFHLARTGVAEAAAPPSKKRRARTDAAERPHVVVLGARVCEELAKAGGDRDAQIAEQLLRTQREARAAKRSAYMLIAVSLDGAEHARALVVSGELPAAGARARAAGGARAAAAADAASAHGNQPLVRTPGATGGDEVVQGGRLALAHRLAQYASSGGGTAASPAAAPPARALADVQQALVELLVAYRRPDDASAKALAEAARKAPPSCAPIAATSDALWSAMVERACGDAARGSGAGSSAGATNLAAAARDVLGAASRTMAVHGAAIVCTERVEAAPARAKAGKAPAARARAAGVDQAAAKAVVNALRDGLQAVVVCARSDAASGALPPEVFAVQRDIAKPSTVVHVWRVAASDAAPDSGTAHRGALVRAALGVAFPTDHDAFMLQEAVVVVEAALEMPTAVVLAIVAARTRYRALSSLARAAAAAAGCDAARAMAARALGVARSGGVAPGAPAGRLDASDEELALAAHDIDRIVRGRAGITAAACALDALADAPVSLISGGRAATLDGNVAGCKAALAERAARQLPRDLLRAYYVAILSARPGTLQLDDAQLQRLAPPASAATAGDRLAHALAAVALLTGAQFCAALVHCEPGGERTFVRPAELLLDPPQSPPPLLVMLGRCPSPAVAGGLFTEGAGGHARADAQTSKLAQHLLDDAQRGWGRGIVALCLEAANPLWFCPQLQALHCARDGAVTRQACPCDGGRARDAAGGRAVGGGAGAGADAAAAVDTGGGDDAASVASARRGDATAGAINATVLAAVCTSYPLAATFEFAGGRDSGRWLLGRVARPRDEGEQLPGAVAPLCDAGGVGTLAFWPAEGERGAIVSVRTPHLCCALRGRDVDAFESMRRSMELLARAAHDALDAVKAATAGRAGNKPGAGSRGLADATRVWAGERLGNLAPQPPTPAAHDSTHDDAVLVAEARAIVARSAGGGALLAPDDHADWLVLPCDYSTDGPKVRHTTNYFLTPDKAAMGASLLARLAMLYTHVTGEPPPYALCPRRMSMQKRFVDLSAQDLYLLLDEDDTAFRADAGAALSELGVLRRRTDGRSHRQQRREREANSIFEHADAGASTHAAILKAATVAPLTRLKKSDHGTQATERPA
ncbi:hypothetical protein KFE25_011735 [Diacronema lutheri]|uniref:Uncharacterized protein n=1 Tax=Diacronema lutheri TaxID=2081491 RepID=A0A8J5X1H0_DIALT|nr:hypothetical protein KFE25_011735 [Diacronema lutheri]